MTHEYENIPTYMIGGIVRYLTHGIMPGSFLQAVFENDLMKAFHNADATNKQCVAAYAFLLYFLPNDCYGSRDIVEAWSALRQKTPIELTDLGLPGVLETFLEGGAS